jgi:casein kinase II subunit alpha
VYLDKYEVVRFIEQGRFSFVFETINVLDNATSSVMKIMKSPDASKLMKEIQMLRRLRGVESVVQLRDVFKNRQIWTGDIIDNDTIISTAELVFDAEKGSTTDWHAFSHQGRREGHRGALLGPCEVRLLMRQLLRALRDCHARGIMHRDVKPENVIVNVNDQRLLLIDFGLRYYGIMVHVSKF